MKRSFTLATLIVAATLGGCASTSDMNAVRDMAQQAMDRAQAAEAQAQQASKQAAMASSDAAAAMSAAKDAQACCEANTQRINRAFESSMKK